MSSEKTDRGGRDPLRAFKADGGAGGSVELIPTREEAEQARARARAPERPAPASAAPRRAAAPRAQAPDADGAGKGTEEEEVEYGRDTFVLPASLLGRLRDAVYYTHGETKNAVVERALLAEIARMEDERGEPFPKREKELPRGRRMKI